MAEEMDEQTIEYLNGPGDPRVTNDEGLGQLLRMTRSPWLGVDEFREPMIDFLAGRRNTDPWGRLGVVVTVAGANML